MNLDNLEGDTTEEGTFDWEFPSDEWGLYILRERLRIALQARLARMGQSAFIEWLVGVVVLAEGKAVTFSAPASRRSIL